MVSLSRRTSLLVFLLLLLTCCESTGPRAVAGKAVLSNGTEIPGTLIPIKGLTPALIRQQNSGPTESFPIFMVHSGHKRYFVPRLNIDKKNTDWNPQLDPFETFEFKLPRRRKEAGFAKLGPVRSGPWSKYGRRTVTVAGIPKGVVQGITKITPHYVMVEALSRKWKFGLAITSFTPQQLDTFISTKIDPNSLVDRKAVVQFFIQAGMYPMASRKLDAMIKDFPAFRAKAKAVRLELRQLTAKQIINELQRRQKAGQHQLVYRSCTSFPKKDITAAVLTEILDVKRKYDEAAKKMDRVRMLTMDLESLQKDDTVRNAIKPMRSEISSQLNYDSLPRLDSFLKFAADDIPSSEKLALAYSGWILGSGNAIDKLDLTIKLWEARFLVMEYLRTENPTRKAELLSKIEKLEGVGPQHIGWMIPQLPPLIETPDVKPGKPATLKVAGRDGKPAIRYAVMLPPEYKPTRSYPMIVALRPEERSILTELEWWAGSETKQGQAQRRGYIVIAPEYTNGKPGGYDYSTDAHVRVIECIRDARKRFKVDSDRVFLSGHGSGGDAAFDIGMSHPYLFAGVMPITGISDKYCMFSWQNAKNVPWYVVGGELARDSLVRNARELTRMIKSRPRPMDVICVEYIGRGYESYYEEIHNLFEWMELHRRRKYPKQISVRVQRTSEDRFWWLRMTEIPKAIKGANKFAGGPRAKRPQSLEATITPGNTVRVRSPSREHTLWFAPEMLDYAKRVRVVMGARTMFSGFLSLEIETLLDDLRIRGDRQKPFWTRLDISPRGVVRPAKKKATR